MLPNCSSSVSLVGSEFGTAASLPSIAISNAKIAHKMPATIDSGLFDVYANSNENLTVDV